VTLPGTQTGQAEVIFTPAEEREALPWTPVMDWHDPPRDCGNQTAAREGRQMSNGTDGHEPADGFASSDDNQRIYEAVRDIAEKRAAIEQAKGMLMFVYGIDEDGAFDLLRWQSQQHNVKLRLIAEQIVKDLAELARTNPLRNRMSHDQVLLTAHQRIAGVADRQRDGQTKTGA
jgi:hypothetical protein